MAITHHKLGKSAPAEFMQITKAEHRQRLQVYLAAIIRSTFAHAASESDHGDMHVREGMRDRLGLAVTAATEIAPEELTHLDEIKQQVEHLAGDLGHDIDDNKALETIRTIAIGISDRLLLQMEALAPDEPGDTVTRPSGLRGAADTTDTADTGI